LSNQNLNQLKFRYVTTDNFEKVYSTWIWIY